MPELPEVEELTGAARPLVQGRTILRCRTLHKIAVRPWSGGGAAHAASAMGQRVKSVERQGKYLILRLAQGCLVLHFRLYGKLLWFDSRKITGHVDLALEMEHGILGFVDRRHFGRVAWATSPEALAGIAALGIDPLSKEFTPARLADLLARSSRPLNLFLVDQAKIAGIGDIWSNEAMWRARIDPRRPARMVSAPQARRMHKAIVDVLRRALECCLYPAPDLRDANWCFHGLGRTLRVYGREGKRCRACRARIRRIEQGGRSTCWCAQCQR